jgi:hypothetical protein
MHDLNHFTPAGDLNRDETLLAMGRASARPNHVWIWLCAALVFSNLATVTALYWPRPEGVPPSQPAPVSYPSEPLPSPDPSSVIALSHGLEPMPTNAGAMLNHPVLRAGSSVIE